jgi:quinol monooxygenase YgiN
MFIRIVKMSFEITKVDQFIENFNLNKDKIRNFEGCSSLKLLRDKKNPAIFFTYSHWESEKDLDNYKNSELFKSVWKKTKILFNNNPQAWSVDIIESL